MGDERLERRSGAPGSAGYRDQFKRDRDRLLYSKAFRRLNGVSQVVSASEGATYHNRMIHSLKVAQVGRRLAESLLTVNPGLEDVLNPDVVESAALAHDMGHPPFGHIGEMELSRLAKDLLGLPDGYEGNPQNIRILTKLEVTPYGHGLDLTRATLQAITKYPRSFQEAAGLEDEKARSKFGYYETEKELWGWIDHPTTGRAQTVECQIMEWADDVSYALHDLLDFYRIGLIPLDHFLDMKSFEAEKFIQSASQKFKLDVADITETLETTIGRRGMLGPYQGYEEQRKTLYRFTNNNLDRFLDPKSIKINVVDGKKILEFDKAIERQINILKYFTKHYVIKSYALNTIQAGQKLAIAHLVQSFYEAAFKEPKKLDLLPNLFKQLIASDEDGESKKRLIIDLVAGLTDQQALDLFHRLSGVHPGSIRNPLI